MNPSHTVTFRRPFLADGDFLSVSLTGAHTPVPLVLSLTGQDAVASLRPGVYEASFELLVAPVAQSHSFTLDVSGPCEVAVVRSGFLRRRVHVRVTPTVD